MSTFPTVGEWFEATKAQELQALEVRRLHAVAEAATQVRLHVVAIGGGRKVESAWQELCLALDAAGYGPDGFGHSVRA